MRAFPNEDQERFWNEVAGPLWVASEDEREAQTGPFGEAALALAAPRAGEAVLDVGCGCGSTTATLAAAVGASGRVLGVDLSAAMLARAQERIRASGAAHAQLRRDDAQSADLGAASFDLVFSRFGVMFFADPVAGFANLCGALRGDGRMVFVCWQAPSANPWMAVVNRATAEVFGLDAPPHDAPGPFSLAERERTTALLHEAGFAAVEMAAHERQLLLGAGQPIEDWVHQRLLTGPARPLYMAADPDRQREARAVVLDSVAVYQVDPDDPASGLSMPAAAWIVHARP